MGRPSASTASASTPRSTSTSSSGSSSRTPSRSRPHSTATTTSSPSARCSTRTRRSCRRYTTEGGLQATLDFGFQASATGFANGRPTTELRDFFASDDYYTDRDSNAYALPTFLGNHDMGRIGLFLRNGGASGDELLQRDRLAHALMYLSRGQPVVYYGDEQGFVGDGGDQDARQDMFPSQVGSYNDDDLIGTIATTADDNFDPDHPLYRWIGELAALRDAHPALADGAQLHRYASSRAGIYAFSRIDADEQREYVVAANNSEEPQTATFATSTPRSTFRGAWPADAAPLSSDAEGRVTVTVPPLSVVVWRAAARARSVRRRAERVLPHAGPRRHRRWPGGDRCVRAPARLRPGDDRLAPGWCGGVDGARHRRQRALPRVPRRVGAPGWLAPRVPRRAPRRERPARRRPDVRDGRRSGPRGWRRPGRRRACRPAGRGERAGLAGLGDGLPRRLAARVQRRPSSRWTRTTRSGRARTAPSLRAPTSTRSPSTARGTRTTASAPFAAVPTSRSRSTAGQ